ncbi:uncharacterized protein P884DRAFT_93332 [Thermothelomyces heterothallicus CBS 202.75]|uniref:uncharacterized protein n=1 Tax=Thermothelomyces heterothallicus CBS 202.75 TaxID=1149848 RepID=UPI0037444236
MALSQYPSSANSGSTQAPTAGSSSTAASSQSQPSPQMVQYLGQPAAEDSSTYGRLAGQPLAGDPAGRVAHYTARAEHEINRFNTRFRPSRQ